MEKFTSIEQFRHVVKGVREHFNRISSPHLIPTLTFIGTVKLHGTNAGVRRFHGKFQSQSREQIIDVTNDNYGFAKYVASLDEGELHRLFDQIGYEVDDDITIYGEWCGPGIQENVAITLLPTRQWVIFAAKRNGEYVAQINKLDTSRLEANGIYNIHRVDPFVLEVNFKTPEKASPLFEQYTKQVEDECPWAKSFGISGLGEGIVWKCLERPTDSDLWFKTKGQKHSKSKVTTVAPVDVERVENIRACVELILPEGRLKQGLDVVLNQQKLEFTPQNFGAFMKWIAGDILKEESDTITENGFEWKEIVKEVNNKCREWYFTEMNKEF